MVNLKADEIMRLLVELENPELVGVTPEGNLRVIPIVGGRFTGDKLNGRIVPGGADWNLSQVDDIAHVFAKYLLETDDGEFIAIENEGLINPNSQSLIKTVPKSQSINCTNFQL